MNPQVHVFAINGTSIALDVGSSNLFVVDEEAVRALRVLAQERGYELDGTSPGKEHCDGAAYQEVRELVDRGWLFSADHGVEAARMFRGRPWHGPRALCFNIAHACNMNCAYCFASAGTYRAPAIMPLEVAERAVDFLIEGWPGKRCEIDFFGGEPLLAWDTMVHTIVYAEERAARRGKRIRFTCTTNGTLLTEEKLQFFDDHRVALVVSLDGRPEVHDALRCLREGGGSYARALRGAQMVAMRRGGKEGANGEYGSMGGYYVRGTYTARNLDFYEDVKHLVQLGLNKVSLEPVVADRKAPYSIEKRHLPAIAAQYDRLAEFYLERWRSGSPFRYFHFELKLRDGPCLMKRVAGCGAGVDYMAVAPDGTLWPCHQFDGREGYQLGDVWQGITRKEVQDAFRHATPIDKNACRTCWARYLCGGGCHANAAQFNDSIFQPWELGCEIQKIRLERALYVQTMMKQGK
ncbi:MAG TPA: thioether cross-link-forming SCIFF peptide maturase [Firmicutes bacterium]|nr:thioether cross-link-forming SCIFF peptide maturase [Bacillota bacterium]